MRSKNWLRGFAPACGIISLVCAINLVCAGSSHAQTPARKSPAIALLDGADSVQWQNWTRELGWQVIAPAGPPNPSIDVRVQALAAAVETAIQSGAADAARIYLAGRGEAAAAVFYAISRVPDLWAAGAALGGSPKGAIDTNRLYTANFTNVPVMWIAGDEGEPLARKLKSAGLNIEWHSESEWRSVNGGAEASALIQWLGQHQRDAFPVSIDCETNSPTFARCYWIQMTKFDPNERNDVLPSTRVPGGSGAALDLGGFGFKIDAPGPGVLVSYLPDKYSGPLKMGDRIVAMDGKEIRDARQYAESMEKVTEERSAVVAVQRGKDRIRVETRVTLPRREAGISARVQAQYLPADKEVQIVSRTVTEMRVMVAPEWVPATLSWNGVALENLKEAGCYVLTVQKELLHADRCK
jgi:predicted esterase